MNQPAMITRTAQANNGKKPLIQFFYVYSGLISAVASGGTGSVLVPIQADAAFLIMNITGAQIVNNARVANPYTTVQMTDTGSGTNLFDQQQMFANVIGTAELPFILPVPRLMAANSSISIQLTNVNSAAAATYYISFLGVKLYYDNQ